MRCSARRCTWKEEFGLRSDDSLWERGEACVELWCGEGDLVFVKMSISWEMSGCKGNGAFRSRRVDGAKRVIGAAFAVRGNRQVLRVGCA